ncbi:MAG: hypothetical protein K1X94_04280 [Sandaracinaceae bacterium]|nr:hypothetical protein [Sandaracinaceae bacterium]
MRRVVSWVAAALPVMATSPLALAGCITQDLQFVPPTGFPPSIEVPSGGAYPLDEVIRLRADQIGGGGDAGAINTLVFDLEVRDPDVDEELQYLVYVDYQRGVTLFPVGSGFVPAVPQGTSDRRRRAQRIQVPVRDGALSRPGCHRVEILVSQRFRNEDGVPTRDPLVEGDLGTATWWVSTQATEGDSVDMTGCP